MEPLDVRTVRVLSSWTSLEPSKRGVYFVRAGRDGHIRIGSAHSIEARVKALQTSSPFELHVLAITPGAYDFEHMLHARFRHLREFGEWFRPGRDLLDLIELVRLETSRCIHEIRYLVMVDRDRLRARAEAVVAAEKSAGAT